MVAVIVLTAIWLGPNKSTAEKNRDDLEKYFVSEDTAILKHPEISVFL